MASKAQLRHQFMRVEFLLTVAPSTATRPAEYDKIQGTEKAWKVSNAQMSVQNNIKYRKDIVL